MPKTKRDREEKGGRTDRHKLTAVEVPRQCPLVLLIKVD
jgi:hypothetical protein